MAHKYEQYIDQQIARIKATTDPEESRHIAIQLVEVIFACDASHTLRDWEWHIQQGHVTAENQYKRYS